MPAYGKRHLTHARAVHTQIAARAKTQPVPAVRKSAPLIAGVATSQELPAQTGALLCEARPQPTNESKAASKEKTQRSRFLMIQAVDRDSPDSDATWEPIDPHDLNQSLE